MSLFQRFREGLSKTRASIAQRFDVLVNRRRIDEQVYEELEEALLLSDVGATATLYLLDQLRDRVRRERLTEVGQLRSVLIELMQQMAGEDISPLTMANDGELTVILVIGVNGAGKTTTIGKLARQLRDQGKQVLVAAGDTFRAGAIEQLQMWADRAGVEVIRHQMGSDPAAVMFDAVNAARGRGVDVLLCDTAGRLHNKTNLMDELNKIVRVIRREIPNAPHEVLLVLDATTGQNALLQARQFTQTAGVTGLVLSKLDSTAKGGMVLAIRNELGIPVKFVGLGEKVGDLEPFDPVAFVNALLPEAEEAQA